MTELDAYLNFRKEIDTIFYSKFKNNCTVITKKDKNENVVGLLIVEDPYSYIDCLWVEPSLRGNGIGYKIIMEYILDYGLPNTLRILHDNHNAYEFWNKVFNLTELEANDYDSLYQIDGLINRSTD